MVLAFILLQELVGGASNFGDALAMLYNLA